MTEDEAKTKACCGPSGTGAGHDFLWNVRDERLEPVLGPRTCIASACMAWRGKETMGFANKAEVEFRRTGRRLEPTGADIEGYCGLAGAPR